MNRRRTAPPVIPEIAKAYQNDPRTLAALAAVKSGTSTAPVAAGGYGYADGIARVLQGAMGGYADRQQQEQYGQDQQVLLDQRKARGVDGLSGVGAPTPPQAPPGATAQAPAIAAALGAPPAPAQAPGPPSIPMAPVPPPGPPPVAPGMGGGPMRRPPFGARPAHPGTASGFTPETVPNAPQVLARPAAPEAVGATRSKLLDAAYRVMSDANPYESAAGQDMYTSGLSDQSKLDESAAERRQRLADMGYSSDLNQYADSQSQARGATYAERSAAQNRNFQGSEAATDRTFKAGESAKDRAQQTWATKFSASTQIAMQRSQQVFESAQNDKKWSETKQIHAMDDASRHGANSAAFFTTKAGAAIYDAAAQKVADTGQTISTLSAFEQKLKTSKKTGGMLLGNVPGAVVWSNSDLQQLESMTNQLSLANSKDMKGSLSDKDVVFLKSMVPSIRNTRTANVAMIQRLRGIAERQREFTMSKVDAMASGEGPQFLHDWSAYSENVPVGAQVDFNSWRNTRPKYDANGNLVGGK